MTTNTGATKTSKWAFDFKSGYAEQGVWETTCQELTPAEQLELGVRVCIEKNKESLVLADALRNPNEPSRYILQQPFHELFKDSAKILYDKLIAYNAEQDPKEKEKIIEAVKKEINENFPEKFLDTMAPFYNTHISKPNKEGNVKTEEELRAAKKEFMALLMFQFASSEISANANNDPTIIPVVSSKLKELYAGGAFDGLLTKLDNRLENAQSLKPVSEEFQQKIDKARNKAFAKIPEITKQHDKLYEDAKNINLQIQKAPFREIDEEATKKISMLLSKLQNAYNPAIMEKYSKEITSLYQDLIDKAIKNDINVLINMDIANLNQLAKMGELAKQTTDGKTRLESIRESGNYTDEQYAELVKHANDSNKIVLDLENPENYQLIRAHAVEFHYDENFVFSDGVDAIEKLTANIDENQAEIIEQSNDLHKKFIASMSELVSPFASDKGMASLNLPDEQLKRVNKLLPLKENASKEEIQAAVGALKEIKDFCHEYIMNQGLPTSDKAILQNKSPIHMVVQNDNEKPKFTEFVIKQHQAKINDKNPEGQTPLQLAQKLGKDELIPLLIKAGANPDVKTTDYKRDGLTRFTDTVKGLFSGKGLTQWNKAPERSVTEIAEISGRKDIVQSIQQSVHEKQQSVAKEKSTVNPEMLNELSSKLSSKPPKPSRSSNPLLLKRPAPLIRSMKKQKVREPLPVENLLQGYARELTGLQKNVNEKIEQVQKKIDTVPQLLDAREIWDLEREIKGLKIEKDAIASTIKYLGSNPDIETSEGKTKFVDALDKIEATARKAKEEKLQTSYDTETDLPVEVRSILSEMRTKVSQPEEEAPTIKHGGIH